jgi:hypothetical protein
LEKEKEDEAVKFELNGEKKIMLNYAKLRIVE